MYITETWTLNKADRNRIAAFEMRCWRRMLRISWTKRRTNANILEEIGVSKRLLHTINIQMLSYFGHIARRKGNNLEKVIMQGMIEGKRKKGRPWSRWIDQIRSAIGPPLRDCYALAEDRLYGVVFMSSRAVSHDRNEPTNKQITLGLSHAVV